VIKINSPQALAAFMKPLDLTPETSCLTTDALFIAPNSGSVALVEFAIAHWEVRTSLRTKPLTNNVDTTRALDDIINGNTGLDQALVRFFVKAWNDVKDSTGSSKYTWLKTIGEAVPLFKEQMGLEPDGNAASARASARGFKLRVVGSENVVRL
jgi:hypothetical protein